MDEGSLPAHPQGWCSRYRWCDGGSVRANLGGQSFEPPGAHQVGPLSSATGPAGIHPQGRWSRISSATRPSNLRGQGSAKGDRHGAGGHLRAGLPICSYGFRPGRSAHQALQALHTGFMRHGLRWVIDLDIENYFGSISHSQLRSFLDRRVTDGVIRRMIDKWLKAGVLEDGLLRHATEGSPQGGVISPCLSNVFLHHVLDEW